MNPGRQPAFTPNFSKVVADLSKGVILKPLLHAYLYDAEFPGEFSVTFRQHKMRREEDGWFHPSTHPLWPARKLWLHHRYPEETIVSAKEYMGTLSVTMGHAVHSFIQMCLQHLGVLETAELYLSDEEHNSRGHTDGVLTLHMPQHPNCTRQIFEFKTSNLMKLSKLKDLDLDAFRATWPDYYMQVQEYLRISGLGVAVVLFMAMGYPWEMREFHIPADPMIQRALAIKYQEALGPEMPQPCCAPGSKTAKACEMRSRCPVAIGTHQ